MPDIVRESMFNLLRGHPAEGPTVDLFAGSGAVGFEALSRGSPRCVFIERDRRCTSVIESTAREFGVEHRVEVVIGDAFAPGVLGRVPLGTHLAFLDPPYALAGDAASWSRVRALMSGVVERLDNSGFAVLRTPWPARHAVPAGTDDERRGTGEGLNLLIDNAEGPETHAYGSTAVHLYMRRS